MKAVIFDMDGVLADTQKLHAKIESEIFRELGIDISPSEMTRRFAGLSFKLQINTILKEHGKSADIDEIDLEKYEKYIKALEQGIEGVRGARPLVEWLYEKKVPMAIATSNKRKAAQIVVKELGLNNYIKVLVTSEDISLGKPSPDIFLEAAKRININPKDCIVIEDGESGLIGAKKAGMKTLGYNTDVKNKGDYSALTMDEVKGILKKIF
ncbi:MAG: HAD family phosphatase [Candidatus Altiarchaeota archaeon]|nr:HAD family phosphatase [Candidatus Altiarchaeota archaeon]